MGKLIVIYSTFCLSTFFLNGQIPDYVQSLKQAKILYSSQEYRLAKEKYLKLVKYEESWRTDIYYLAKCYAQIKQEDSCKYYLTKAARLGLRYSSIKSLNNDSVFSQYFDNPDWSEVYSLLLQNTRRYDEIQFPVLRKCLDTLLIRDQKYRSEKTDSDDWNKQKAFDKENRQILNEIISEIGWPSISKVGAEGSKSAWLIAQHSDDDLEFQLKALKYLEDAVKSYDADKNNYAYLFDRVQINQGLKQKFGTQYIIEYDSLGFIQNLSFKPILDTVNVDLYREYYGLPTLAEYKTMALKHQKDKG
ncbi:DUF6624 domain-containing protein [Marinoscillum pacificum]|uniref:DUF6624 domain-containing protein n=1 Tax=Marinoscillum pacificum TaxID=392723 RepID=UPI002157FA62|nr:DUF6624 domain-containing protein [Marinoscillum pacificum]